MRSLFSGVLAGAATFVVLFAILMGIAATRIGAPEIMLVLLLAVGVGLWRSRVRARRLRAPGLEQK